MSEFSTIKLLFFFPFPYCIFWKEVLIHSPHLKDEKIRSTSLRTEYLHKLFVFCMRDLSLIYLFQYGLIDIYFILLVIIQYYFISLLKLFQFWPLGALSVVFHVPLTYSITRFLLLLFFLSISFCHLFL